MNRLRLAAVNAAACFGLAVFAAAPAKAIITAPTTTYEFTGNCEDCAVAAGTETYIVHAQLVLDSSYVLGTSIAPDFVSFTYDGSNLLAAFTVGVSDVFDLSGELPTTLPGPPKEDIDFRTLAAFGPSPRDDQVSIRSSGFWFIGQEPIDFGGNASFSSVPEPSTWAMMLVGFAGLALAGWRARRRSVAIAA
jgi:hypothetical protein